MTAPRILPLFLLIAIMAVAPNRADAQYAGGGVPSGHNDNPNGPTVSPYLNLLQNGNAGITNYQSLVKPLIDSRSAINQQGSSIRGLQRDVNRLGAGMSGPPRRGATGHTSFFMEHTHYYNFSSGRRR